MASTSTRKGSSPADPSSMPRTVFLSDWDQPSTDEPPAPPKSRLQYTPRNGGRPCRYPNEIRRYRIAHQLRQEDVATRIGCSRDAVSKWVRGQCLPQGPKILRLARVLDTFAESSRQLLQQLVVGRLARHQLLSRAFSSSSCLSRLASVSAGFPYFAFHV